MKKLFAIAVLALMTVTPSHAWKSGRAPNTLDFVAGQFGYNGTTYNSWASYISASGSVFTRGSTGYNIAGSASFSANVIRTEPVGYLLLEPGSSNLQPQSNLAASWSGTRTTITANSVLAPDGTTTAAVVVEDSTASNTHQFQLGSTIPYAPGTQIVSSLYAKRGAGSRNIQDLVLNSSFGAAFGINTDLGLGSTNGSTADSQFSNPFGISLSSSGNYYRTSLSTLAASTDTTINNIFLLLNGTTSSYSGDGTSSLNVWCAQVEQPSNTYSYFAYHASSCIPTTTASATRAADALTLSVPTGTNTARVTFDNSAQQIFTGLSGSWVIPIATLNRPMIRSIEFISTDYQSQGDDQQPLFTKGSYSAFVHPDPAQGGWAAVGSISGTTMTISSFTSGSPILQGSVISGGTTSGGTTVLSQLSGTTGGVGNYQVSKSQTVAASTSFLGTLPHTESILISPATYPSGAHAYWNWPIDSANRVKSYMQFCSFGNYLNTTVQTPITSKAINAISTLLVSHNFSWRATTVNGFNVIYDFFLYNNSSQTTRLFEFEIVMHPSAQLPVAGSTTVGTTTISNVPWTVYKTADTVPIVQFIPTDRRDINSVQDLDIKAMLTYTTSQGVTAGTEVFTGIGCGLEALQAQGWLYVNSASVNYNFLLKRDIDPASNDNDPMWLEKAA